MDITGDIQPPMMSMDDVPTTAFRREAVVDRCREKPPDSKISP
jgi:hypothetical protein